MSKLLDIAGQRFGFWMVQKRASNTKNGRVQWTCICECGQERNITTNSLRSGNSTSCGCNHNPDLINEIFGDLTVLELHTNKDKSSKRNWLCKCSCGNFVITNTNKLKSKIILSCGCKLPNPPNENLSAITRKNIQQSVDLIKEQSILIIQLNEELEKSVRLLAKFRTELKVKTV